MNELRRDFDQAAATWDDNPVRIKLAKDVAKAITDQVILTPDMAVMDFGCGTGLLTMLLQPMVGSITGVDSSRGMLDTLNAKIGKLRMPGIKTEFVDPDRGDRLAGFYHLIVSNMTLHHIKDTKSLLGQFFQILAPGGYLCISDLDPEGGLFHNDNTGVFHHGFDRAELRKLFSETGFTDVRDVTAAEMEKPAADGKLRKFSIFLMTGRR